MATLWTTHQTLLTRTAWWTAVEQQRAARYQRLGRVYQPPTQPTRATVPPFALGLSASGAYVTAPPSSRLTSTHIIAVPGVGKTNLLETLAMADIKHAPRLGVIFIDPHGDVAQHLLWRIVEEAPERIDDVVLLEPEHLAQPFGLPLYPHVAPSAGHAFQRAVDQSVHVYEAFWGAQGSRGTSWGPQLALVATAVGYTLIENDLNLLDIPRLVTDSGFRRSLRYADPLLQWFWEEFAPARRGRQDDFFGSFVNKVLPLAWNHTVAGIAAQRQATVDLRALLDRQAIVLVPLKVGIIGRGAASILGSILIGELFTAARSRADLPEHARKQAMLYLDEYQLFQSPDLLELEAEARKYRIGLHRAHQRLGQLSAAAREGALMADNLIVGRVPGESAAQAAGEFDNTPTAGPAEYKPVMVPSAAGLFEQLRAWADQESLVQYQQVPGPERSTDEMRQRRQTQLAKLPSYEFMAKLLQGRAPWEYTFRAIASPCYGRTMPGWVAARIEAIRQRSRETYCRPREEVDVNRAPQPAGVTTRWHERADDPASATEHAALAVQAPLTSGGTVRRRRLDEAL